MVQLMFECPSTGQTLLASKRFTRWDQGGNELISMHCPKCSQMHVLGRENAVLVMTEEAARA